MRALTRKEAQKQLEFLLALHKLDCVLSGPLKTRSAKAKKAAAVEAA